MLIRGTDYRLLTAALYVPKDLKSLYKLEDRGGRKKKTYKNQNFPA